MPRPSEDRFGPVQYAGCLAILGCMVVLVLFASAAGVYSLATGHAIDVPVRTLGAVWLVVVAVAEVMAFGWLFVKMAAIAVCSAGVAALLIEGVRAVTCI